MGRKADLRRQRTGTVLNVTSSKQEGRLAVALASVAERLQKKFHVVLEHESRWFLHTVVAMLRATHAGVEFSCHFENTSMKPDGGILSVVAKTGEKHPLLITEVKNQGTNDLRSKEGKRKQAKGNAVERLGKNVIGFRAACLHEAIFPFVCFGDGCDFAEDSAILDRVSTIAMFSELNKIRVLNEGATGQFNRGSFFFREAAWTSAEMTKIMYEIAERSLYYYFSKYGQEALGITIR